MGIKGWFMKRTVRGMSGEEKESMMEKMMEEFFAGMTSEEKKGLLQQMMPQMMENMMKGLTSKDRQELMGSMMPSMMAQMFGGEGGMPSMMMQMMGNMPFNEKEGEKPCMPFMETPENFKPWEFCPCRKHCENSPQETESKNRIPD